jgi:hypothetical protein
MTVCQECSTAIDAHDRFCRNCGAKLGPESNVIASDQDFDMEFDDEWVTDFDEIKAIAKIAIPDNFKEVTLDHLRRRVIQAIWIKSRGIDPYSVLGIGRVETDEDRRRKAEAEAEAEAAVEGGAPSGGWVGWAGASVRAQPEEPYHLVWSNGLISHANLTGKEAERIAAILARVRYEIHPCDCDAVPYAPSETNPGFLVKM